MIILATRPMNQLNLANFHNICYGYKELLKQKSVTKFIIPLRNNNEIINISKQALKEEYLKNKKSSNRSIISRKKKKKKKKKRRRRRRIIIRRITIR